MSLSIASRQEASEQLLPPAVLVPKPVPRAELVSKPVTPTLVEGLVLGPVQLGPCAVAPSARRGRFASIAPGRLLCPRSEGKPCERRGEGLFPSLANGAFSAEALSRAGLVLEPVPSEVLVLEPVPHVVTPELVLEPVPRVVTPELVLEPVPRVVTPELVLEPVPRVVTPRLVLEPVPPAITPRLVLEPVPCAVPLAIAPGRSAIHN